MLSRAQEKLIRNLMTKKGRREAGLCLAEGRKLIDELGDVVDFAFSAQDTPFFNTFAQTQTPQDILAVVRIPIHEVSAVCSSPRVVLLDHVQDPGNVGAFFRLALAFNFTLLLRECADPFSPKVIRASAGAVFHVPYIECKIDEVQDLLRRTGKVILKFEKTSDAIAFSPLQEEVVLIFGNEGQGILGAYEGQSVFLEHDHALESLSVSHAGAIAMYSIYQQK